jgi:hypothetical protein
MRLKAVRKEERGEGRRRERTKERKARHYLRLREQSGSIPFVGENVESRLFHQEEGDA